MALHSHLAQSGPLIRTDANMTISDQHFRYVSAMSTAWVSRFGVGTWITWFWMPGNMFFTYFAICSLLNDNIISGAFCAVLLRCMITCCSDLVRVVGQLFFWVLGNMFALTWGSDSDSLWKKTKANSVGGGTCRNKGPHGYKTTL